ncbi:uncharacterized protein LOC123891199 [Trifolium pratense]|uniref:Uncharacterized protein n=1 Tax=Trifolium pratense TaxID=57577 RepID=A0ACB0K2L4_TRIPR|nr:uncharacterized protein LOC123891199 [Trifolium pratense]CAJ2651547.1 unnamed protein product [Trifolium pratense]
MAKLGATHRTQTISTTPSSISETYQPKNHHEKLYTDFQIYWPFSIPLTSEAAAIRIIRNLENLALYYTLFMWIILFIILIPYHKTSLILLVIMTYVITIYHLLLKACPNNLLLHRRIDKRFVLGLLVFATIVQLILTDAGIRLAVTLACVVPLVLMHAVLWVNHYVFEVEDDACCCCNKELAPLVGHCEFGADGLEIV